MSPPMAVAELLAHRADDPRTALVEGASGRSLGWAELAGRARVWTAAGFPAGSRVGLVVGDPLEMAAAFLGAVGAGLTVAPLDPGAAPAEIAAQIDALGLGVVVADTAASPPVEAVSRGPALWQLDTGILRSVRPAAHPGAPGRGAALVLASSGTTGAPKLVPLTQAQLLHTARAVVAHHRLGPEDVGYSPLPLFHINGLVVGVLSALVGGHRLVLDRRFSASGFWDVVAAREVTWCNLVPAILTVLSHRPAPEPAVTARVRFARSASAPLHPAVLDRFEALTGIPVIETYGMTEAGSQITANPLPPEPRCPGSVGVAVGLDLRVVDADRSTLPAGRIGEVEIRGDNVIDVYWERPGAEAADRPARAPDGWLATGDLGHLDAGGYLHLTGRADDVINRGGEKVYPREVEEVLAADPEVAEVAVVGRPHPIVGAEPVAFVTLVPGACPDGVPERLSVLAAERLSRFRRPAEVVVVESLPSGTNGKIKRAELRRALAAAAQV